jgi:hypothetical protein
MPTTSPSIGDQRPARIAGVGRGVELDQVGQDALAFGRAEFALQARDHAVRRRRADAERKAHRHDLVAGRQIGGGAHGGGLQVVGDLRACSTARSCSRLQADDVGVGLQCRRRRSP